MAERDPFASMSSIGEEAEGGPRPELTEPGDVRLYWLSLVGIVVGVWVAFWPVPHVAAVAAAVVVPLVAVALAARSKGRLTLVLPEKGNKRPSLALLLLPPMIGLGYFAFRSVRLFYWTTPVWAAGAGALALATCMSFAISRADRVEMDDATMMFLSGLVAFVWAVGLLVEINSAARIRNQVFDAGLVTQKIHTWGRRSGDRYRVVIRTLDGQFEEDFPVYREVYDGLREGDFSCIVRTQGALGIWWRDFDACPTAATAAP